MPFSEQHLKPVKMPFNKEKGGTNCLLCYLRQHQVRILNAGWHQVLKKLSANSYFPRYLGVYLCISRLYLYVGNGNKAAVRNEMRSFLWSCKVTSIGPMKCPLLYNG